MRSRGRKQRTLILSVLCCLLVFMGIGYSVFQSTLNIGGTSTALNTWDIRITSIEPTAKSDGATSVNKEIDVAGVSATFNATFTAPGDYIEYTVTVTNGGSIGAVLDSIIVEAVGDDADLFTYSNTAVQGQGLPGGESTTFKVRVDFNSSATRLPEGEVKFDLSLNYVQGEGTPGEGGGGGNTPNPDDPSDWLFDVDENGEVVAYNYNSTLTETPQNVVVPATVGGVPVTTITEQSFIPKGNFSAYMDEQNMKIYALINEDDTVIVDTANNRTAVQVVGYKALMALTYDECQGDASCLANYTGITYLCTDKNSCYAYTDETRTITASVPESGLSTLAENMYINPDPNVALEESIVTELKANIETLDLSNATNLTTIEANALKGSGLTSVEFGDNSNITTIGDSAFANNELTSVEIPASVETIGQNAFSNSGIQTLTFDTGVTVQNQLNQKNKYSLSKMGSSVKKTATLNSNLKTIGQSAFAYNQISSLTLPEGLTNIGGWAFTDNKIEGELILPESLTSIESSAFSGNKVSTLFVSSTVTTLGYGAFSDNPIETLSIEDVSIISGRASDYFGNNIKTLTIESGRIEDYLFQEQSITNLTLGEEVTSIGVQSFNSDSIEKLSVAKCTSDICSGTKEEGSKYFGNSIKELAIASGPIGEYAFYSQPDSTTKISSLTLGSGITSIGKYAFANNAISSTINYPTTPTTISEGVFSNNLIPAITIPDNIKTIEYGAFANNSITSLVIPNTVESIGEDSYIGNNITGVFENNEISSLTFEEGTQLEVISDNAFSGNNLSGKLVLPNSIEIIGYGSFSGNSITGVTIPTNVTRISNYAFAYNPIQGNLVIPSNVTILGYHAFRNNMISGVTFAQNNGLTMSYGVFENNQISGDLVISEGTTYLDQNVFYGNQIVNLTIPSTVTSIGDTSFANNPTLATIFINRTETDFLANVTVGTNWYDTTLNPSISYKTS